jgi:hypothetical protein
MKKSLFFIMAFIVACSLCVTNSSCNDKKVDGADSMATDSTLVDTTAADSTDEIIAEIPSSKYATRNYPTLRLREMQVASL